MITRLDKNLRPVVLVAPRSTSKANAKVEPLNESRVLPSIENNNTTQLDSLRSIPSQSFEGSTGLLSNPSKNLSLSEDHDKSTFLRSPTPASAGKAKPPNPTNETKPKKPGNPLKNWYNGLTPVRQRLFKVIIGSTLALGLIAAIVIPLVYVYVIRQAKQTTTSTTTSACPFTTCIGQETPYRSSIVTVLYPFEGSAMDVSGYAAGTLAGPTTPGFTTNSYVGQSIQLNSGASSQYVSIPSISFSQQSFTIQIWLYPFTYTNPNEQGILCQCDTTGICLAITLRNGRVVVSFDSMNNSTTSLMSATLISANTWTHVTVVYDAQALRQSIYVNGVVDSISRGNVTAYQGVTLGATTSIGRSSSSTSSAAYFSGRIDHLTVSIGTVRSACEILNDASLAAYYPFETTGIQDDYSVYFCNGFAASATILSVGHTGQALFFPLITSYFQAQCFASVQLSNPAFTVSLWINPNVTINGGTLVHLSSLSTGSGTCYDLLAFSPGGALVVQWMMNGGTITAVLGPLVSINTWTHVAVMYGQSNGVRLFVNGQLAGISTNTGNVNYQNYGTPMYITLANVSPTGAASSSCTNGTIPIASGSYTGAIDEFRLYNREMEPTEICVLANS